MAFPFVQVQVNPNSNQNFSGTSGSNNSNSQADSGFFDSLMSEYSRSDSAASSAQAQGTKTNKAENNNDLPQSSNYSHSVSQNVLNILASQVNVNNANIDENNTGLLANAVFQAAGTGTDEAQELLKELNNINGDDAESKLLLANIAERIIDKFSDRLSTEDRNKLSALAAGLKASVLSASSSSSLSSSLYSSSSLSEYLSSNSLSSLIAGMTEAEISAELTSTIQSALSDIAGLNSSQNQGNIQAENLNLNNKAENKININNYKQNVNDPVSNDDDEDKSNDGDNNGETNTEYGKLNYEYNNYAALNSIVNTNQGAAESQAFFTQDTAEQTGSISLDYSASQTSTSERSSSSSATASTTSSTSLKSQNARSSQSTGETNGADLKNARINSQRSDGEGEPQRTASNTATGTATDNEDNNNDQGQGGNLNNNNENSGQNFNSSNRRSANNVTSSNRNQNQNERDGNLNNNNRLENSRQDFQSFFEGVLNNRRTASRTEAAPLNLRPDVNYNYSRAETLRDGIVNVVRFTRADGNYKANMIVDPPALGRITVELTSNTSGVEASIKVVNEQVRQLVQDQVTQLRMTLEQQGVQVTQFAVDVQQDNAGRQQDAEQQGGRNNRRTNAVNAIDGDDDTAEEFRIDLNDGLLYWVA